MVLPYMDAMPSSFQVPGAYFHFLVYGDLGFHVGITFYTIQTLHLQVRPLPAFLPSQSSLHSHYLFLSRSAHIPLLI